MESTVWTIDWNPEFESEAKLKREILKSLNHPRTIATVKRFAEFSRREALDDTQETEHILWLESGYSYAFFVRVWFDIAESKLFILVEENDLGDIGMLSIADLDCASYTSTDDVLRVEFSEPEDLGVPR